MDVVLMNVSCLQFAHKVINFFANVGAEIDKKGVNITKKLDFRHGGPP